MDSADLIKNFMLCTPFHLHYTNTHHKSQGAFTSLQMRAGTNKGCRTATGTTAF